MIARANSMHCNCCSVPRVARQGCVGYVRRDFHETFTHCSRAQTKKQTGLQFLRLMPFAVKQRRSCAVKQRRSDHAPAATFCAEHWHGQPCCSGCNGTLTPGRLSILAPGCDDDAPPSGADEGDSSKGACTHRRRHGDQRGFKPEPLNGE